MTPHTKRIDAPILSMLADCRMDGNKIFITSGQLDRKTYEGVNKVLELMGGKWNKSAKAHVFSEAPDDLLETVLLTGEITDKKIQFQFFETPAALAARMIQLAQIGDYSRVLEPSAGAGAIVRAIGNAPDKVIVEIQPAMVEKLMRLPVCASGLHIHQGNFLECNGELGLFDAVVMNPPFARGQDITHILHARSFLKPGGRLIAICANGPRQRERLMPLASFWEDLPADTFKESGTSVNTALLRIDKEAL